MHHHHQRHAASRHQGLSTAQQRGLILTLLLALVFLALLATTQLKLLGTVGRQLQLLDTPSHDELTNGTQHTSCPSSASPRWRVAGKAGAL